MTCNPTAVTSMILKSSLLPWLEMQISRANGDESVKWARILGNIVFTVDHKKMDSTLQSGWRTNICRCLSILFKRGMFHHLYKGRPQINLTPHSAIQYPSPGRSHHFQDERVIQCAHFRTRCCCRVGYRSFRGVRNNPRHHNSICFRQGRRFHQI